MNDPFAYLAATVRGDLNPEPRDLSALENNLLVVEVLDAAIRSSHEGRTILLPQISDSDK